MAVWMANKSGTHFVFRFEDFSHCTPSILDFIVDFPTQVL